MTENKNFIPDDRFFRSNEFAKSLHDLDVEDVEKALEENPKLLNHVDEATGQTLLFAAVKRDDYKLVKMLVKRGADPNLPNIDFEVPLHLAVENKNVKITNYLLEHGADPNTQLGTGETPLHIACRVCDFKTVRLLLLFNANPLIVDHDKLFPIDYTYEEKRCKCYEHLLPIYKKYQEKLSTDGKSLSRNASGIFSVKTNKFPEFKDDISMNNPLTGKSKNTIFSQKSRRSSKNLNIGRGAKESFSDLRSYVVQANLEQTNDSELDKQINELGKNLEGFTSQMKGEKYKDLDSKKMSFISHNSVKSNGFEFRAKQNLYLGNNSPGDETVFSNDRYEMEVEETFVPDYTEFVEPFDDSHLNTHIVHSANNELFDIVDEESSVEEVNS